MPRSVLSRRTLPLVVVASFLAGLVVATAVPVASAATCVDGVRRNVESLTATQWDEFSAAVRQLQQRPSGGVQSPYDALVTTYATNVGTVANKAPHLPFLRAFLRDVELKLQAIDPDVTIPYWDFAADGAAPETSSVWGSSRFGGNGDPGVGDAVEDGDFKTWSPFLPTDHALTRHWSPDETHLQPFASSAAVQAILDGAASYDALRSTLVTPVLGAAQGTIGGDIATARAPNDPLFLVMAAYVDKQWSRWQAGHPSAYGGTNSGGGAAALTDALPGYPSLTVADTMSTADLCYGYDQLPLRVGPTTLADSLVGVPLSVQLTASPVLAGTTFAVSGGALPAGLALSSVGVLSGTPTAAGTSGFTVTATRAASGATGSLAYALTVAPVSSVTASGPISAVAGTPTAFTATAGSAGHPDADASAVAAFSTSTTGGSCSANVCTFTRAGAAQVTVTFKGFTDVALIQIVPGTKAAVTRVSGQLQQADPGAVFGAPLVARVVDAYQNPISDVPVEFTVPLASGATFVGGATSFSSGSHEDGTVTSPLLKAGTKSGLLTVTARIAGVSDPAAFTVVVKAGPPSADLHLTLSAPRKRLRGKMLLARVAVRNDGPSASDGFVRLSFPAGWKVRRPGPGTLHRGYVRLPLHGLADGASVTFTLRLVPHGRFGTRTLVATLRPTVTDPDQRDNRAVKKVRIRRR
jgi:tyrosinase